MSGNAKPCRWCNRIFTNLKALEEHENLHRGNLDDIPNTEETSREDSTLDDNETSFSCNYCKKTYKYKRNLDVHVRVAHDGVTFPCSKCFKTFQSSYNKTKHEKTCTGSEHLCPKCDKRCSSAFGLRRHLQWHDKAPKIPRKKVTNSSSGPIAGSSQPRSTHYQCRHCTDIFDNPRALYTHTTKNHGGKLHARSEETSHEEITVDENEPSFPCNYCKKTYKYKRNLDVHVKVAHDGATFPCSKCFKTFQSYYNKAKHEKICTGSEHVCPRCKKRCSSAFGLRRHLQWHDKAPKPRVEKCSKDPKQVTSPVSGPSQPRSTQYRCGHCTDIFDNRRDLYTHRMTNHFQVGGALHARPWIENEEPWQLEDGMIDRDLQEVYDVNAPIILQQHRLGPIQSIYNFPVNNDITIDQIMNFTREIYNEQQRAFRLNLTFGTILQNRETNQYRYFTPYSNNGILERPIFVSRRIDLRRLQLRLNKLDITTELLKSRPDTKWIPVLVTNVQFTVYSTHYPVGQGDLPEYLLKKQSIYPLIKSRQTGQVYQDNLCAFRCLALHRGYEIKCIDGPAKEFFHQWINLKKPGKSFHGVALDEFPDFENFFNVNMDVYTLGEDGFARSVYKSRGRQESTMYVNLHDNHLSFIRDFALYANKYQCKTCERHFHRTDNLHRHQRVCTNRTKFVYPGGFHTAQMSIFDKLDQYGIHVPENQRTFPWFLCFDFEAILNKINSQSTENLEWTHQHVPISVSICSNVDGHTDPFCIVDTDPNELVKSMVESMTDIAYSAHELAEEKWGWVLEAINKTIEQDKARGITDDDYDSAETGDYDDDDNEDGDDNHMSKDKCMHPLLKIYGQMEGYMSQLPVLAFNSAKYDLNLIKPYLAKHLQMHNKEMKGTFVVKKNNSYACIATENLKFMDMTHFLAAGSSYTSFLKAYRVKENKGVFPYEWFDHVSKLDATALPPHESFYSALKNSNITEEEYKCCQNVWNVNNMTSFRDYLIFYNNLDVGPFVTAVRNFQTFYFDKGIDVFKTAISVPGIARQLLFKSAKKENANFALFDKQNADLYDTIKQNIIGGPSIIFTRHQKAGETTIRGGKTCESICGFDANALYLQAIGQPMPVGPFVRRHAHNGFRPEARDKFMSAYYWMDWLIHTKGVVIQHKLNHGSEFRIGPYPVDGFTPANHSGGRSTVYQYHGCYWHGHACKRTVNIKNEKWRANRQQKYENTLATTKYLKDRGHHVIEMWECQFLEECRQNPQIYTFIDSKRPSYFQKHKGTITENDVLEGVYKGDLFGMVEVDIQVPDQWPSNFSAPALSPNKYFEEMSPLFCNSEVPFDVIGPHMQQHVEEHNLSKQARRLLVGGMKARQILLATPLLKWYLEHGMAVTKIYQVVEFQSQRCFKDFVQEVSEARRTGDADPDTAIIADTNKVIGNSSYGSLIMDLTKHREIKYIQGENETCLKINDPRFRKLECLEEEEQYYEIEMAKRRIKLNLPIQLGYFILQYAKLRMLEFYYDFMDTFVERCDFQYLEMDTDSAYMALSGRSLDDVIKPHMMEKYQRGLKVYCNISDVEADANEHWFPRTCCSKHAKYDKRTPGLFKLEYQGDEMIGLSSKTYIVRQTKTVKPSSSVLCAYKLLRRCKRLKPRPFTTRAHIRNEYKFSSKGVSKRNLNAPMSIFRYVLKTGKSRSGTNRGFRARLNTIFTYTQERRGFSYFYCKRKVLNDGINTMPLDITLCPIPPKPMDAHDQAVADILMDLLEDATE